MVKVFYVKNGLMKTEDVFDEAKMEKTIYCLQNLQGERKPVQEKQTKQSEQKYSRNYKT